MASGMGVDLPCREHVLIGDEKPGGGSQQM